jgi:hypothetical protein
LEALSFHSWSIEKPMGSKCQSALSKITAQTNAMKCFQGEVFEVDLALTAVVLQTLFGVAIDAEISPHVLI